jgi:hypothetical protein
MERWMQAVFTHPDGAEAGLQSAQAKACYPAGSEALDELVLPSKNLTTIERVSIYANMYYWRLIDILADDFPTVYHLLGSEQFTVIAKEFLEKHPSTSYTLNLLGGKFPQYLKAEAGDLPQRDFIAAVARIERAIEDIFDEKHAEPVSLDELGSLLQDELVDIHLQLIPALRLLELDYPVNEYITAVRENQHMDIPLPAKSCVAVYRSNYRPLRVDLEPQQYALLLSLQQGESLLEALESCMAADDTGSLATSLEGWFRDWSADGLFCGIKLTTSE